MRSLVTALALAFLLTPISSDAQAPAQPKMGETKVKRSGKSFAIFYLAEDFKGKAIRVESPCELPNANTLKSAGLADDAIQSVKIPDGYSITVYENYQYGGKSETFTGKVPKLGSFKQAVSSLKGQAQ